MKKYGIKRPSKGPLRLIVEEGRVSMFDNGIVNLIKQKKVNVVPGVTSMDRNNVLFTNGASNRYDSVILATGYRSGLQDLLPDQAQHLLDEKGFPTCHGEDCGQGLYFVGFQNTLRGVLNDIRSDAIKVAKAISRKALANSVGNQRAA